MKKMELFIGPCVLESEELAMSVAERLVKDLYENKLLFNTFNFFGFN